MKLDDVPAKHGISVLYGHRVLDEIPNGITPYNKTTVTPKFLNDFLERHADWQALSLHDIQTQNYHPDTPAFALTFDDGYRDNLTNLLPILEKHDVPTAIFLCAAFCDGTSEPLEHNFGSRLQPNQHGIYHKERATLKRGTFKQRISKLDALIRRYDLQPFNHQTDFLNGADIQSLDDHPLITLGHHTKTHPLLSRLMPWHVWGEMQSHYETIAYPYGGQNIIVRGLAKLQGYQMGFTTDERTYNPQTDNPLAIPRIELKMD
jgi:peptidoglycan/xylan/chitin deacetylase (PgdA/CDA1 family)